MDIVEKKLNLEGTDTLLLFGYNDTNLHKLENRFDASITVRGETVVLRGEADEVRNIAKTLQELQYIINRTGKLSPGEVDTVIDLVGGGSESSRTKGGGEGGTIIYQGNKDAVTARTPTQKEYVDKVRRNDVVFCIGPAGTGKTFLAVAMALSALKEGRVSRIVVSRPAVEAGESLGFLPGDFQEKVDPYLRPIFDAFSDMLSQEKLKSLMEKRIVEVIPLAYMRGRTFNNSFIILDEAQNTTITQMKMFLTRLGRGSKAIVTGDITQIDLADKQVSGLVDVQTVLSGVRSIDFLYFSRADVVRHRLVADIIHAYEKSAGGTSGGETGGKTRAGAKTSGSGKNNGNVHSGKSRDSSETGAS